MVAPGRFDARAPDRTDRLLTESMHTRILDGRPIAAAIESELTNRVFAFPRHRPPPTLAILNFGHDEASRVYARRISKVAERVGMRCSIQSLPSDTSLEHVLATIDSLNRDPHVDGLLIERPLPPSLSAEPILQAIDPGKDVDGVTIVQAGRLVTGSHDALAPCTPLAVMRILEHCDLKPAGQHVVVLGRSVTVGRPLSILLSHKHEIGDATVTLCHSASRRVEEHTARADVVIAAYGRARGLKREHVRSDCVVIDVGINFEHTERGERMVGDCDFENLVGHVAAITPVPGGVGPITVTMLLENTLTSALRRT